MKNKRVLIVNRKRQTQLNIAVSLLHQLVTAVCGLILPRFILLEYGSEANGLVQSISQLLSYTTLMEFGIGGAVRASLYKPLADRDSEAISDIFNHTKKFFTKVSLVFVSFAVVLSLGAKLIIDTQFDFCYVSLLVIILAVNTYFNYYFSLTHQILLKADQKLFVVQSVQMVTTVLNLILCIVAINLGAGIHIVKFITAFVFLCNPLVYRLYVKTHYTISKTVCDKNRVMPKKGDAVVHHMAFFVHRNTDVIILSVFKGVSCASIYSVYNMVIYAIEQVLNAISTGVAGAVGNMLAKGEKKTLTNSFDLYEGVNTFLSTAFFTVSAIVIIPFVKIYTNGVTDAEYIQPVFAYLILSAGFMYCVRIPYISLASTAGHYKETRFGAVVEVFLNLFTSLLLVKPLGLTGVAIGTLVAMSFRAGYIVWYLSKNIIKRSIVKFIKSLCINLVCAFGLIVLCERFIIITATNLWTLAFYATGISLIVFGFLAVVNILMNLSIIKKVRK